MGDAVASSSVGLVVWGWGAVKERGGLCPQYFCPPTSQVRVASKWQVHTTSALTLVIIQPKVNKLSFAEVSLACWIARANAYSPLHPQSCQ